MFQIVHLMAGSWTFELINLLFPYDNRLTYMWILIPWVYCLQELPDVPLFLSLHNLCATLKCTSPSAVIFRSAVINAGYRISGTHVNPLGLKSDAPMDVIWDIMRCWVRLHFHCLIYLKYAYTWDIRSFKSLHFHLCFFLLIFLESAKKPVKIATFLCHHVILLWVHQPIILYISTVLDFFFYIICSK